MVVSEGQAIQVQGMMVRSLSRDDHSVFVIRLDHWLWALLMEELGDCQLAMGS